jgi:hypothetical protein
MPIRSMPAAERLAWTPAAWDDYLSWQGQDSRQLKRINQLIQACLRDAFVGIGKPEPLRENLPLSAARPTPRPAASVEKLGCLARAIKNKLRSFYSTL